MQQIWNRKGMPHKGWKLQGYTDLQTPEATCEMCGKEQIRYVFELAHAEYPEPITAGSECAKKMCDDYTTSTALMKAFRRRAGIRRRLIKRRMRPIGFRGSLLLRYKWHEIVVLNENSGFAYRVNGKRGGQCYSTAHEAKIAAIETLFPIRIRSEDERRVA